MKIYTKTGDHGHTSLYINGKEHRVPKTHPVIKAIGLIDECNANIGFAISFIEDTDVINILKVIQNDLFSISAELASTGQNTRLHQSHIDQIESFIDTYEEKLPQLTEFILPTGKGGSMLHVSRTVVRRTERYLTKRVSEISKEILIYINRLSDLLFVFSRFINQEEGIFESSPTY